MPSHPVLQLRAQSSTVETAIISWPYLNSTLSSFEVAALWSPGVLGAELRADRVLPSPVCTARPRQHL